MVETGAPPSPHKLCGDALCFAGPGVTFADIPTGRAGIDMRDSDGQIAPFSVHLVRGWVGPAVRIFDR